MRVQLEIRHQVTLGLTGALVLLVGLIRFIYLPVLGQIRERVVTLKDLQIKVADAQRLIPQLPVQEVTLQQATQRFETLQIRVGSGQALARILDILRTYAEDRHLEFRATQSPHGEDEERLVHLGPHLALLEVPIVLNLIGRYRHLGEFLGTLRNAPFVAEIHHLSVRNHPERSPQLEVSVGMAVYLTRPPTRAPLKS